jgi:hypothetical protein
MCVNMFQVTATIVILTHVDPTCLDQALNELGPVWQASWVPEYVPPAGLAPAGFQQSLVVAGVAQA